MNDMVKETIKAMDDFNVQGKWNYEKALEDFDEILAPLLEEERTNELNEFSNYLGNRIEMLEYLKNTFMKKDVAKKIGLEFNEYMRIGAIASEIITGKVVYVHEHEDHFILEEWHFRKKVSMRLDVPTNNYDPIYQYLSLRGYHPLYGVNIGWGHFMLVFQEAYDNILGIDISDRTYRICPHCNEEVVFSNEVGIYSYECSSCDESFMQIETVRYTPVEQSDSIIEAYREAGYLVDENDKVEKKHVNLVKEYENEDSMRIIHPIDEGAILVSDIDEEGKAYSVVVEIKSVPPRVLAEMKREDPTMKDIQALEDLIRGDGSNYFDIQGWKKGTFTLEVK